MDRGIVMFYERYISLCAARKIAPSAAATKAGFNRGTVSVWKKKYEAGLDVSPEQDIINKICAYFGCTEQWLRGIAETKKAPTQEGEREITDADIMFALWGDTTDVDEDDLDDVRRYAAFIRERKKKHDPPSGSIPDGKPGGH